VPWEWLHGWGLPQCERRDHLLAYLRPKAIERLVTRPPADGPLLIYTTPANVERAEEIPHLTAHLGRVREVLERRRETRRGTRAWFHLHWPRREALLRGPRVLVPRMTRWPSAALTRERCATGESVYTLVPADRAASPLAAALLNSLPFALGILLTTKNRGKGVDIPRAALASCPWPDPRRFVAACAQTAGRADALAAWLDAAEDGRFLWDTDLQPLTLVGGAAERLATRFREQTRRHEGLWSRHEDPRVAALGRALDEGACRLLDVSFERCLALAEEAVDRA
jgi:hypothetical protein